MSAITGDHGPGHGPTPGPPPGPAAVAAAGETPRRPGFWQLLRITLAGQILGVIGLMVVPIPLALAALFPYDGKNPFVPWHHDGLWATAGLAGWCSLVSMLVGGAVWSRGAWQKQQLTMPSFGWLSVSVGLGGYGALLLERHAAAGPQVLLAVVLTPLVLIPVAYTNDGRPRRWPLGRRGSIALVAVVALAAFSYSFTHPFSSNGGGGGSVIDHANYREIDVGLNGSLFPAQIQSVSLAGAMPEPSLRTARVLVVRGASVDPTAYSPGPSTKLPLRLGWHQGAWVSVLVAPPRGCQPGVVFSFDRLIVNYRILGIATSEAVPLQQPVHLRCTAGNRGA